MDLCSIWWHQTERFAPTSCSSVSIRGCVFMGIFGNFNGIVVFLNGPDYAEIESTSITQCHHETTRVNGNIYMYNGISFSMSRLCANTVWSGHEGQVTYIRTQSSFQSLTDSFFIQSPPNAEGSYAVASFHKCPSSIFKGNNASFNALENYFITLWSIVKSSVVFDTRLSNSCRNIYSVTESGIDITENVNGVNNTFCGDEEEDHEGFFEVDAYGDPSIEVLGGIFISNAFRNYKCLDGSERLTLRNCISSKNGFDNPSFTSQESPDTHTLSERAGFQCIPISTPFSGSLFR